MTSKSSLVIGHGRLHRLLSSIDYELSTFIDRDAFCEPDIVIDLRRDKLYLAQSFDEVIFVGSEGMLYIDMDDNYRYLIDEPTKKAIVGPVHYEILNSLYDHLKPGGTLWINNFYYSGRLSETPTREEIILVNREFVKDMQTHTKFIIDRREHRKDIQTHTKFVFRK